MSRDLQLRTQKVPEGLLKAYALHSSTIVSAAELAAIAEMSEPEVTAWLLDPDALALLESAATKADAEGRTLVVIARKARSNFLQTIYKASATTPIEDIPDLDKVLARVIDQADRVRLAEREVENLPLVHITFGAGFKMSTEVVAARRQGDFIDAIPKAAEKIDGATSPSNGAESLGVLAMPVIPLDLKGGDEWRP